MAKELSKAENSHVTSLKISGCFLGPEGAKHLADMLGKNVWLKRLSLFQLYDLKDEGAQHIIAGVM